MKNHIDNWCSSPCLLKMAYQKKTFFYQYFVTYCQREQARNIISWMPVGFIVQNAYVTFDRKTHLPNILPWCSKRPMRPALIKSDNESVVFASSVPEAQLSKNTTRLLFTRVEKQVARGVLAVSKVPSSDNLADSLTKPQTGLTRLRLVRPFLF